MHVGLTVFCKRIWSSPSWMCSFSPALLSTGFSRFLRVTERSALSLESDSRILTINGIHYTASSQIFNQNGLKVAFTSVHRVLGEIFPQLPIFKCCCLPFYNKSHKIRAYFEVFWCFKTVSAWPVTYKLKIQIKTLTHQNFSPQWKNS